MRYPRQDKIVELITNEDIGTQEELAKKLRESGFKVTQATVSRDIKELQLIKTVASNGMSRYAVPEREGHITNRYERIFRSTVRAIKSSGNIIVVKTLPGCANAAGEAIDSLASESVLGSLAGDNTVFVVVDLPEHVPDIVRHYQDLLNRPGGRE